MPQRGFAHPYLIIGIGLIVLGLFLATRLVIIKTYPQNTKEVQGVLLAKDDGGSSGSDSSGSGSSDEDEDSEQDTNPQPSTPKPPAVIPVKVKTEGSSDKMKTEIKFAEGEKIKTKIKDGRVRIDVYSGGIKVRYEVRDGRVVVKAETEGGEGVPEKELFKIEDRLDKTGIKIATEGGKIIVARGNVGALSSFPLQIDLGTNQLIASTSAGVKILTVLPDKAVQNILAANVISRLGHPLIQDPGLTSVADVIALGERNGIPVYEIPGLLDHKLLGFIPMTVETTVFVSAQTGEVVSQEQTIFSSLADFLSP